MQRTSPWTTAQLPAQLGWAKEVSGKQEYQHHNRMRRGKDKTGSGEQKHIHHLDENELEDAAFGKEKEAGTRLEWREATGGPGVA